MSKLGATSFFVWIQVVLIGNALPLVSSGKLFPSREFDRRTFGQFTRGAWEPTSGETELMVGAYGVVTLLLLWVMILMITPSEHGQIRGWRRARKQGRNRLSPFSDPASAFPWVGIMVVAGAAGWFLFSRALFESDWFPGTMLPLSCLAAFASTLVTAGFGFHALMEGRGARATGLAAVFLIVPMMVGAVLLATDEDFLVATIWLVGLSPLAMPFEAAGATVPVTHEQPDLVRALPPAFWFWQVVAFLVTLRLVLQLRASRKAIAKKTDPLQAAGRTSEPPGNEDRDGDDREEQEREDLPPAPASG